MPNLKTQTQLREKIEDFVKRPLKLEDVDTSETEKAIAEIVGCEWVRA